MFRLLFPEEESRRKYDMQETRLACALAECFGFDATSLQEWNAEGSSGCLGQELRRILSQRSFSGSHESAPTLAEVDALLSELASHSPWSHPSLLPRSTRSKQILLRLLFRRCTCPDDAAFLVQIILKDLSPLLYPLPEDASHYTVALKKYNSKAVTIITKDQAMRAWDPSGKMTRAYRVRASLEEAARAYEEGEEVHPLIGVPIQVCPTLSAANTSFV